MRKRPSMTVQATRTAGLLAVAVMLLSLCGIARAQDARIVLLASARSALYEDFITAYREYFKLPGKVHLTTMYLDESRFDLDDIAADTDLVVTIGTRAAQLGTGIHPGMPVLNTLIPASSFHALAGQPIDCRKYSAVFIDQPVQRQALLAHLLFPDTHRYGVLLGPTSSGRRTEIEAIDTITGIDVDILTVTREPGAIPEARRLVRQADLLLAVYDPLVLNRENAKWLLYTAYQEQVPVIGFSRAYVRAGAAAAVYSEAAQMARQAAELTAVWLKGPGQCLPAPQFTRYFDVAVNPSVCESLGCKSLPEKELARAVRAREATR